MFQVATGDVFHDGSATKLISRTSPDQAYAAYASTTHSYRHTQPASGCLVPLVILLLALTFGISLKQVTEL
ncbi:hypothetical protein ACF2JD_06750 [Aeromonas sp. A-5]|uniref:hypothetical protein n=1 Tax=Aeromonas ichthyocola TaxID=3367746 RepID=UPI0038E9436E